MCSYLVNIFHSDRVSERYSVFRRFLAPGMMAAAGPLRLQPAYAKATAGAATSPDEAGEETNGLSAARGRGVIQAVGAGLRGACNDGVVDGFSDWREADEAGQEQCTDQHADAPEPGGVYTAAGAPV